VNLRHGTGGVPRPGAGDSPWHPARPMERHSGGAFPSRAAARAHYRDVIEPGLNGKPIARRDLTLSDLVEVFLERHAIVAKPRTVTELRWRLKHSEAKFGTVPLIELDDRRARRARAGTAAARQPLCVHDLAEVPREPRAGAVDVANFRRREWGPAIDAAGIAKPARLYDLRSTFASNALAAGITMFELARIMGTSAKMIEQHSGTLIDTAHDAILTRLEGFGTP
jgi:hypothetical protein